MIGSAFGHTFQSQSPAIPGKGRCPHLNASAIGELELDAFTLEGLLGRELHHGFQIGGGRYWRRSGRCRGNLASGGANLNPLPHLLPDSIRSLIRSSIRFIDTLTLPALGPAVAKQFGEVVLKVGKAPGERIAIGAGNCIAGILPISRLPKLPFERIREHRIGLIHQFELVFSPRVVGVEIGMPAPGLGPKGPLQAGAIGPGGKPQHRPIILACWTTGHRRHLSPQGSSSRN